MTQNRDQVKWMCLSAPPRTGEDKETRFHSETRYERPRPLSLPERLRHWETSAQWGRDHTWCTAVIIPVCVLWAKITADTGMSHRLQSQAERQKKWGESCRQKPGVPPFVFSCKLRCLEVDGNCQLEVTLWKYEKKKKNCNWGRKWFDWEDCLCDEGWEHGDRQTAFVDEDEFKMWLWTRTDSAVLEKRSVFSRNYTRLAHAASSFLTYLWAGNKTNSCRWSRNTVSHAVAVTTSKRCIQLGQSGFNSKITLI